jgi:hypothetical protein
MDRFDLQLLTMFAELQERVAMRALLELPTDGAFYAREVRGRRYWYHRTSIEGRAVNRYVGIATSELDERIGRVREQAPAIRQQRQLVQLLRRAGFPAPGPFLGSVLQALAGAGLFRLRGCLVGTVAYAAYSAMLGVRLPITAMATQDVDVAQFHGIAVAVGYRTGPLLEALRHVDPSFAPVPALGRGHLPVALRNDRDFRVELLTPHQGRDEHGREPVTLPSIEGLAAQPLRFLDYLIHQEVPTVVLHRDGVPVNVPPPERFAVHKLVVASRRPAHARAKAAKDIAQAAQLIDAHALAGTMPTLADAFAEAWDRSPAWREGLHRGVQQLGREAEARQRLMEVLPAAIAEPLASRL